MDIAKTTGKTLITCNTINTGVKLHLSVVSRRLARVALIKSHKDQWKHKIMSIDGFDINNHFRVVGFQPETGFFIAVMQRKFIG